MSHTHDRFTKYHATAPATWHQIKAITRRCEDVLGREQYKFGLQLRGIGLTCLRKTDQYDWRGDRLYDSTKSCLTVHFGSATSREERRRVTARACAASNVERLALSKCTNFMKTLESAKISKREGEDRLRSRIQEQATAMHELEKCEQQLLSSMERASLSEDALVTATEQETELTAKITKAEETLKRIKKKLKKIKGKEKRKKGKEAKAKASANVEEAERNALEAREELAQAERGLERSRVRVQEEEESRRLVRETLDKASRRRRKAAGKLCVAMRVLASSIRDLRLLEKQLQEATEHREVTEMEEQRTEEDQTFSNWPGRGEIEFPNDFKNYQAYASEDSFELEMNRDRRVDLYFQGMRGQQWTKEEKIQVAACVGNVLGWTALSGPCCSKVKRVMDDMLQLQLNAEAMIAEEQRLLEEKWKSEGRKF